MILLRDYPYTNLSIISQYISYVNTLKYKDMGEKGKAKLHILMRDMYQCGPGKNQAIWDHYTVESFGFCSIDLKDVTTRLIGLKTNKKAHPLYISDDEIMEKFNLTRKTFIDRIWMIKDWYLRRSEKDGVSRNDL